MTRDDAVQAAIGMKGQMVPAATMRAFHDTLHAAGFWIAPWEPTKAMCGKGQIAGWAADRWIAMRDAYLKEQADEQG